MSTSANSPPPEPVTRLWDRVKKALAENDHPSPRDIDRLAASIGLKLAASTIEGWFKACSVVPAWEKFEVLIKALGAEQDEDWRALHGAALTADRERKKEERRRKELAGSTTLVPSEPLNTDGEPVPQRLVWNSAPAAVPAERSPDPRPTIPTDAVHTTAAEGGTPARGHVWTTPRKIAAAVILLVLAAVLILVFRPTADVITGPTPPVRLCTYVNKEPAPVYPAPDSSTKQIKFKHLDDRVEVLDRPHPSGWVAVSTPQDSPGVNWMQTNVLSTPAPCTASLRRQS